jgi:putative spermidine/putrescine transport system ATP-binding protein
MQSLVVDNVSHSFTSVRAVDSVSLGVAKSELIALLGPSGCGKTTLLRMIAGFVPTLEGSILLNGRDITTEPPHRRNTGMVFQNYALFPHMTVAENVAFGLKMRAVPAAAQRGRVEEALRLVRLDTMIDRYPRQLSGGQQQRVAIARALVIQPEVFLLDEPLSNLDAKLRYSVGLEIRALQQRLELTTVFVTHDQTEALALADRLVLMDGGRVIQSGTASDLYARPANTFVANFLGRANLLPGRVRDKGNFITDDGLSINCAAHDFASGSSTVLCVRPEQITISASAPSAANSFVGTVEAATYLGSITEATVRLSDTPTRITVHHQNRDGAAVPLQVGMPCSVAWLPQSGLVLDRG